MRYLTSFFNPDSTQRKTLDFTQLNLNNHPSMYDRLRCPVYQKRCYLFPVRSPYLYTILKLSRQGRPFRLHQLFRCSTVGRESKSCKSRRREGGLLLRYRLGAYVVGLAPTFVPHRSSHHGLCCSNFFLRIRHITTAYVAHIHSQINIFIVEVISIISLSLCPESC